MVAYRTYVNLHQTQEDRRRKYRTLRANGFSYIAARRIRDWPWKTLLAAIDNKELNDKWMKEKETEATRFTPLTTPA